jgi:hypothetical protein
MTDAEIEGAEMQHNLRFPPDYRLFLTTLHTPDPPMVGAAFEGDRLVDQDGRAFVDWQGDPADVKRRLEWPLDGLLWSIEANIGWNPNWGPRPRTKASREAVIRKLAMSGPQLVPVAWHAYVAGPPERTGNPVLSMYGADVIVYASDLRQYLLTVFHLDPAVVAGADPEGIGATIPFWADVIETGLPEHHGSSSPR